MNNFRLIQRIRETALKLQAAKDANDVELQEELEDELFELEEQLEEEEEIEYDNKRNKEWY